MRIKICGLSRMCDIDYVNEANPDYIGFVFAKSKRQVTLKGAHELRSRLDMRIYAVGVFADEDISVIHEAVGSGIIDIVQLHGNEDEEYISKIEVPVIKAVRMGEPIPKGADFILFDSPAAGSGRAFDWSLIPKTDTPFFLAGGINSLNIDEAMRINPFGIDVSSGVETDGFKDREKITEIVRRVRYG